MINNMKDLYFAYNPNTDKYNETDTKNECQLKWIIGDFLSTSMRLPDCPVELIRLKMDAYTIVVRRRPNNIKVEFYDRI